MDWFRKIFKSGSAQNDYANEKRIASYHEGLEDFKVGRKLFKELVQDKISADRKNQKTFAAIEFFDKAIEKGYKEFNVFSLRGLCLRDLHFDLDAIDDFSMCIEKEPEYASGYYNRAMTKQFIYDYEGSSIDFKDAIRLSKIDNDDNRFWNEYAKQTGFESAGQVYERDLNFLSWDIHRAEQYPKVTDDLIKMKKDSLKRRNST